MQLSLTQRGGPLINLVPHPFKSLAAFYRLAQEALSYKYRPLWIRKIRLCGVKDEEKVVISLYKD